MILIVEDNPQVRRMIRSLVEDLDDEFCEREDGTEAFAAFAEHRPNWVLMDVQMPRMDGFTATRQIIAAFPDAKVAIVTSYDDPNLRRAAEEAGAREYVVKENLLDIRRILTA